MTIEFARNVLGLAGANSSEFDPQTPAPGDRPHGHPARRHRQGRHHAPRRLRRRAAARARRSPRPTATRSCPSATATATSSTRRYRSRFEGSGLRVLGRLARRSPGRVHRARRPPVLGRHAGPPRVQEPPEPAGAAVPGVRRRRAGSGRGSQPAPHPARSRAGLGRTDGARLRSGGRAGAFRQARPSRRSTRAPSSPLARRHLRRARRRAVRARHRAPPGRGVGGAAARRRGRAGAPVPGRARPRPARDPGRQARRRRASRPRTTAAPRAGRGGRAAGPAGSSCWPSSTTRRASATSSSHMFLGHRPDRGRRRPRRASRRST